MRNKKYREELKKLNQTAWSFYIRFVCHQPDKKRSELKKIMKIILQNLEYLIEESESI